MSTTSAISTSTSSSSRPASASQSSAAGVPYALRVFLRVRPPLPREPQEDSLFVDMQGPGAVSMTALKEKPETLVAKTARILAMRWLKQACPSPEVDQATKEATNPSPDAYPSPNTNPNPRFRTVTILLLKRPQSRATAQPLLHCRMGKQGEMRPTQPRRQRMPC